MSELSKQALKVDNNTSFPNNNNGAITPSILRAFNVNMIDSLVDEIGYTADSASWNQQIDALEAFTSSAVTSAITGSSLITASFDNGTRNLTFTKGNNTTFAVNIPDVSGSSGNFATTASFNAYTQSTDNRLNNIESTTASLLVETNNLELFSASALVSLSNLNSATASLFTSTSLSLTTASVSGQTMTFRKGDGTTFDVTLPAGSGSGGNISVQDEGSILGNATSFNFNGAGVSATLSAGTASITIPGGGGTIDTGSFATTGSNTFTGDQTFIDAGNNFFTITDTSGSMMLVGKSYTSASAHLSSSVPSPSGSLVNLIFKTNNNTADTIISGSNNIFQNPAAPTAGFKRYIGQNNIFSAGPAIPQISASMQFSPTVNGNIGGVITMRGPVSASIMNISNNVSANGVINFGAAGTTADRLIGQSAITNNFVAGQLNVNAASSNITQLTNITQNNINGVVNISLNTSAVIFNGNSINDANFNFTNIYSSGSVGTGQASVGGNTIAGNGNILFITGSQLGLSALGPGMQHSIIQGNANQVHINAETARFSGTNAYQNVISTAIIGNQLRVTGSSNLNDITSYGSAFVGRFNARDGVRDRSSDIVFAVGTGTQDSNRKTGFHITSGSNSFFEGNVSVSGSLSVNGLPVATGSFATTGSNTFTGVNTFNERINVQGVRMMSGSAGTIYIGSRDNFNPDTTGVPTQFSHTVIGMNALQNFVLGDRNTVIGRSALQSMATGSDNLAIGAFAAEGLQVGSNNFFVGTGAGSSVQVASDNFFLGNAAGNQFRSGSSNVIIGSATGLQFVTGSGNLFFGRYGEKVVNNVDNQFSVTYGDLNAGRVHLFYKSGSQSDNLYLYGGLEVQGEIHFSTGSNQQAGTATLDGGNPGTVTVSNSLVTANSIIMLTKQTLTNSHMVAVSSKGTGTFTIVSNGNGDTDVVGWMIINNS
jgi:hypothetical protein